MEIEFKISGLAELDRALRELPLKASKRIMRQEISAAAELWAAEMRAIVRRGPHHAASGKGYFGLLAAGIVKRITVRSDLSATVDVGPKKGLFWALFLELTGRKAGRSRRGRNYPAMPHYPFMRPAFESQKANVLERFTSGIRNALEAAGLRLK